MSMTLRKQLNILAERTYDNKRDISEKNKQRRNQVVDMYGMDISRESNSSNPYGLKGDTATLYVSVSPDLVYYERFQFKLYINSNSAENFQIFVRTKYTHDGEYKMGNIDITPYLKAQEDGEWIEGGRETAYPNNVLEDADPTAPANAYDMLEVADMMYAEGNEEQAEAILRPEFKKFLVRADGEFFCAMILYLKYSHLNR